MPLRFDDNEAKKIRSGQSRQRACFVFKSAIFKTSLLYHGHYNLFAMALICTRKQTLEGLEFLWSEK